MPELSRRRRMLVLAICCMSLLIVSLDATIVNVALPALQRDLRTPVAGLQWTIDAYTLVLASLLIMGGSIGDRFGRRRTFQCGLVLFSLASLLCSLAPGLGWLVAFRILQAIGGAMLNPIAMSIITNVFVEPRERARAIGLWGGVVGISLALGPVVGGALIDTIGWRAIFWINVPFGLATLALTALFVPESRAPRPRRVDPAGQLLVLTVLASVTYGIIEGAVLGWSATPILACFALAASALAALVLVELRHPEPLIDPRFFRSAPFSGALVVSVTGFSAYGGFLLLNTLYLQGVRDFTALRAGIHTLPIAVTALVFSPLSGRIVGTYGSRLPMLVAGAGITGGGAMMIGLTEQTPISWLLAVYLVLGVGIAMVNPPITNAAVSGMPRAQAGVAAAMATTSRQVGFALGVAIAGAVLAAGIDGRERDVLGGGFIQASAAFWWIVTGSGAVVAVLGLLSTGRWAERTAERTATRLLPP